MAMSSNIRVIGARQHNLQDVSVSIPKHVVTVITGPSGSGKSSLAFDTIYAEGQRKYIESLSAYARQLLEQLPRPDVDHIEGLCPTIAIEQRSVGTSPRSTVATTTEIHDYLRVLLARLGVPVCWHCGRPIVRQSTAQVVDTVLARPAGQRIMVLAPLITDQRGSFTALLDRLEREGFVRVRIDGEVIGLADRKLLSPKQKHSIDAVVDRLVVKPDLGTRLAESVELAMRLSSGRVTIAVKNSDDAWSDERFSAMLSCPEHGDVCVEDVTPKLFSFNTPAGACGHCHGLGTIADFDPDLIVPDLSLSLADGAVSAWRHIGRSKAVYDKLLKDFCQAFKVLPDMAFRSISESKRKILLLGTGDKKSGPRFEGVIPNLNRVWLDSPSEAMRRRLKRFQATTPCLDCQGTRFNRQARCVQLKGLSIDAILQMTIREAQGFFDKKLFTKDAAAIGKPLTDAIKHRLKFLCEAGVEYLTLDRPSSTLSGGEWQRIRLATQIGSGLSGVCYVLDEPTVGLHPRDSARLAQILEGLTQLGNTIIVVEHDEEIIRRASHMIDVGPGAGREGGLIVAQGSLDDILACDASLTGRYLKADPSILNANPSAPVRAATRSANTANSLCIALPTKRRTADWRRAIQLKQVAANNLKSIDVRFPIGCLTCVTGVSGSGKSTLVFDVLLRALRRSLGFRGERPGAFGELLGSEHILKIVEANQAPIGKSPRSNPATFVGVFDLIRTHFSQTREAKIRGYAPARFSFNVDGGRCENCQGQGSKRIEMHFLPDVFVACPHCQGTRYNRETLDVRYRGKHIADVLSMTVDEAADFFENFAAIGNKLNILQEVGLGYITLGQSSSTLSGGEAQRIKLAAELNRSADESILYVLDEPTTGLHFSDVDKLLVVLNRLVDNGHSVICIEHNLDVIKVADWIIDLGPEGGDQGGAIVAAGTPEQVAECEHSYTGQFLRRKLSLGSPH